MIASKVVHVADPRVRFGVGVAWLAATAAMVRRDRVGSAETRVFRVVNDLRRPRPAALLANTHRRGPDAAGLGYLSGHGAVVMAMGVAAFPRLRGLGRGAVLIAVPVVGAYRMYVGAHLPIGRV